MSKVTISQIAEFCQQAESGRITREMAQFFLEKPELVLVQKEEVKGIKRSNTLPYWVDFYKNEFGIDLEITEDQIPACPTEGKWQLLIVAKGIATQPVFEKCTSKFKTWKYTDESLDEVVTKNDRTSENGSYSIWVRDVVEADKEFKNLSANEITEKGIVAVTLLERLLHELVYFLETGKHLDIKNVTLCAGSRYEDGNVPYVYFVDGKVYVHWSDASGYDDNLRAREAVSRNA